MALSSTYFLYMSSVHKQLRFYIDLSEQSWELFQD